MMAILDWRELRSQTGDPRVFLIKLPKLRNSRNMLVTLLCSTLYWKRVALVLKCELYGMLREGRDPKCS